MTIRVRKYIVEFELRTQDNNPDELMKEYLDGIESTHSYSNSPERLKVTAIKVK